MKSVRDIFLEVLVMKCQNMPLDEIRARIVDIGHDNGFRDIRELGGPDLPEFKFPAGDMIIFDGNNWHYRQPVYGFEKRAATMRGPKVESTGQMRATRDLACITVLHRASE